MSDDKQAARAAKHIRRTVDSMPEGPAKDQMRRKIAEFADALEKFPAVAAAGDHSTPENSRRTIEAALQPAHAALHVLEIMLTAIAAAGGTR